MKKALNNPQVFYPIREDTLKKAEEKDIIIIGINGHKDVHLEWVGEFEEWEDGDVKGMKAKDVVKKYDIENKYHYFKIKQK